MRVLIDEDTAVQLVEPLRRLLLRHEVIHLTELAWAVTKDRMVLSEARRAGYHVIITRDRGQLDDPAECDAIKESGLHHIRYGQRDKGVQGLALALGAVIAAMPLVMAELEAASGQLLVHIAGLDPRRRFEITDPRRQPPSPSWPR